MNLKQLEAFVYVAEAKSFSSAAKKLYLTQPTISAHIHTLEQELGSRLFIRTTKEVKLSVDGERLYKNAKNIVQLQDEILRDFSQKDSLIAQNITVGTSTVPGQYILPRILSLFSKAYPQNRLELMETDSMEVVRMVQDGHVEIGFTGTMVEDPTCVFEPFYDDRLVIIAPNIETYQQCGKNGFPMDRFYEERWIMREEGSGTRKEAERHLREQGIDVKRLEVVAAISNQETIKKSVSTAMGIAIISAAAVEDYVKQGLLLSFPLAPGDVYRNLYMVWSKSHKPGNGARQFIEFVRKSCTYL